MFIESPIDSRNSMREYVVLVALIPLQNSAHLLTVFFFGSVEWLSTEMKFTCSLRL